MLIDDPQDKFLYHTLTLMMDSEQGSFLQE